SPSSLSSDIVKCIYADRSGILWIGTDLGGVDRVDPHPAKFTVYRSSSDDANSLSGNVIKAVTEEKDGTLWVGTFGSGLNRLSPDRSRVQRYRHSGSDRTSIRSDEIISLLSDSKGRLWVGTTEGLDRFDASNSRFVHYRALAFRSTEPGKAVAAI